MKDLVDTQATREQVENALGALTDDEALLLEKWGNKLAFGTVYATGLALLGEAVERACDMRRKWYPANMTLVIFLRNTMASLSSNEKKSFQARQIANVSALSGDDLVVDDEFLSSIGTQPENSVEDLLIAKEEREALIRDYDALYAEFGNDVDVYFILDAMEQGLKGSKIKEYCNLGDNQYDAARKRLKRRALELKAKRTNDD